MAVLADVFQIRQTTAGILDTLVNKPVGAIVLDAATEQLPVDGMQGRFQLFRRLFPAAFVAGAGK